MQLSLSIKNLPYTTRGRSYERMASLSWGRGWGSNMENARTSVLSLYKGLARAVGTRGYNAVFQLTCLHLPMSWSFHLFCFVSVAVVVIAFQGPSYQDGGNLHEGLTCWWAAADWRGLEIDPWGPTSVLGVHGHWPALHEKGNYTAQLAALINTANHSALLPQ